MFFVKYPIFTGLTNEKGNLVKKNLKIKFNYPTKIRLKKLSKHETYIIKINDINTFTREKDINNLVNTLVQQEIFII